MKENKKNAFTLIELIAVLVILAVIALIVTPLVLNIVKKAKDSANKRSVDAYGKATELAVATYLLDTGDYPTTIDDLTVEYSGNEVICNVKNLNEDGSIYLSECSVAGTDVKDSSTEDGWYHYGKTTTVAYDAYNIGDTVTYNGMDFYVIADSDENSDSVILLKSEPLTVDEVNTYGTDANGVNHVNRYTYSFVGTAYDQNGYGGMAYYSSSTCGCATAGGSCDKSDCESENATSYDTSDIKYVVDAWTTDKFDVNDLKEDSLGYKARLLTYDELINNLGYILVDGATVYTPTADVTPSGIYDNKYGYWTMNSSSDDNLTVYYVGNSGSINSARVTGESHEDYFVYPTVRPVIALLKSAI